MKFSELNLPAPLQQAIDDLGFSELTPVQEKALPRTLSGHDIAGQGRTGTGKTAAFLITILNRLLTQPPKVGRAPRHPRALIIAPTRELAIQISGDAAVLAKYTEFKLHTVYGGIDYEKQRNAFHSGVDVLIGTPGRLIDYHKQRLFSLRLCEMLVVDEADRMFDLGFIKDLRYLLRRLPKYNERQSMLFSATLSYRVLELAYEHMNNAEKILAEEGAITAEGIDESLYNTGMDEKLPLLISLLREQNVERGMIFINEKSTGEKLARALARYGFTVGILSGDVRQKKRTRIVDEFSSGKLHLLVATDVASRGLHIDSVTHVFNYDLPEDAENYVHRIGRTARAGAKGIAVSFVCERFCFGLPDIETFVGHSIPVVDWDHGRLDIGPPTDPDATAEGLSRKDRAAPQKRKRSKSGDREKPKRRRRRSTSSRKNEGVKASHL